MPNKPVQPSAVALQVPSNQVYGPCLNPIPCHAAFCKIAKDTYQAKLASSDKPLASLMVVHDVITHWNYTHTMIECGLLLSKVCLIPKSHLHQIDKPNVGHWQMGHWPRWAWPSQTNNGGLESPSTVTWYPQCIFYVFIHWDSPYFPCRSSLRLPKPCPGPMYQICLGSFLSMKRCESHFNWILMTSPFQYPFKLQQMPVCENSLTIITLQRRTISMSLQQVEPLNFFFFKKKSHILPSLSLFTVPVVVQCSWQGCLREGQNSVSTCHWVR